MNKENISIIVLGVSLIILGILLFFSSMRDTLSGPATVDMVFVHQAKIQELDKRIKEFEKRTQAEIDWLNQAVGKGKLKQGETK